MAIPEARMSLQSHKRSSRHLDAVEADTDFPGDVPIVQGLDEIQAILLEQNAHELRLQRLAEITHQQTPAVTFLGDEAVEVRGDGICRRVDERGPGINRTDPEPGLRRAMQEVERVALADEDHHRRVRSGEMRRVEQMRGVQLDVAKRGQDVVCRDLGGRSKRRGCDWAVDLDGSVRVACSCGRHVANAVLEQPELGRGFGEGCTWAVEYGVELFCLVVEDARSAYGPVYLAVPWRRGG